MGIDLLVALLALAGIYLGYQRGLILAVFSFVSLWLGIFLAFHFTSWLANWLGTRITVSERWLPILAFLMILIGVVILVRLGAKALEGMLESAQLGIFNRLAGSLLYLAGVLSICAALFVGLQWINVIAPSDRQESYYLQHIQPVFLQLFDQFMQWIPGKKDLLKVLEEFFHPTLPDTLR